MSTANAPKKPSLKLTRLSQFAQIAVQQPPADDVIDAGLIDVERQVRTDMGDLTDLVNSIKASGVIQPVLVLLKPDGRYRLIAGERRFRAALLAGVTKIPIRVRRGQLSDFEIRVLQVAENNDREDLSAFDEAMGVVEDIEKYGFKEALKIWNRSEAWLSKRAAVVKYSEPVRALLRDRVCGDLEVLHSLNQLHALSLPEYEGMVQRLRGGVVVSREDARSKVAAVKGWRKESLELQQKQHGEAVSNHGADNAASESSTPYEVTGSSAPTPDERNEDGEGEAAAQATEAASRPGKVRQVPNAKLKGDGSHSDGMAEAKVALYRKRADLKDWGTAVSRQVEDIAGTMQRLGLPVTEGEWVFWSGFLDAVLPMLQSLGPHRTAGYLRRLQVELKARGPMEIWSDLHPAPAGADSTDAAAAEPVAAMPDGWTFY